MTHRAYKCSSQPRATALHQMRSNRLASVVLLRLASDACKTTRRQDRRNPKEPCSPFEGFGTCVRFGPSVRASINNSFGMRLLSFAKVRHHLIQIVVVCVRISISVAPDLSDNVVLIHFLPPQPSIRRAYRFPGTDSLPPRKSILPVVLFQHCQYVGSST